MSLIASRAHRYFRLIFSLSTNPCINDPMILKGMMLEIQYFCQFVLKTILSILD